MLNNNKLYNWKILAEKQLKGKDSKKLSWISPEGIKIKPLYMEEDLKKILHLDTLPGFSPFIRGPMATMYAGRPWTIRQYAGFSNARESNLFYKKILKAGQKGLSVAFDLPTHRGYDSDHFRVMGDVGKAGVAIDSVEDMKILFDGIPLDKMSVSMTMNGAVLPIMASYIVAAEEQGVEQSQLSGTIQNDILKEYLTRNTYIYPPKPSMKIVSDIIGYCSKNIPKFNTVSISGYHIMEAGADSVLQVAFTLANGIEYVKAAMKSGMDVDSFAPRLSFFFGVGMNFFMEISMLRASRLLWHEIMTSFNPKNERSKMLRTHVQTSGWSLTEQDPYNNIIRTTLEALSAVLGGTQSLHTNSFDEAVGLPTSFSARIARNTQIILQNETQISKVIDPLGGSYYIESLTNSIVEKARVVLKEIKNLGGMVKAIESGMPKNKIEEAAARKQARIDQGKDIIVGVNKFKVEEKSIKNVLEVSDEVRKEQIAQLKVLKKNRDNSKVKRALLNLYSSAEKGGNLLSSSISAIRARATIGEISKTIGKVFGKYVATTQCVSGVYLSEYIDDKNIKLFRKRIDNFYKYQGRRPRILLCKMGQDGHDRGVKIIATAFADLGFDIDISPMFQTPDEISKIAVENDVHLVGVSTLTASHKILLPRLVKSLKHRGRRDIIVIAGGVIPHSDYDYLNDKGISLIFGPGTPILFSANKILDILEINIKKKFF